MPSILIIAPHADDELFGVGGTALKFIAGGWDLKCVLVTCSDIVMKHRGLVRAETRLKEFESCCSKMSTKPSSCLHLKDSKLDSYPIANLISEIERELEEYCPDIIFIPEPSYHQDHQQVHKACIAALRPTKKDITKYVYEYEIPTSVWGSAGGFNPNFYVEISEYIDEKEYLLEECYPSQYSTNRGRLAAAGIVSQAKYRGVECNVKYAEAFKLLRGIS